uniref:Uncharacterized protein n=1 Tax=candidate division CPR3 bacterium TaxID=2268181 RepID=A0A7V3JAB9_UNCC3
MKKENWEKRLERIIRGMNLVDTGGQYGRYDEEAISTMKSFIRKLLRQEKAKDRQKFIESLKKNFIDGEDGRIYKKDKLGSLASLKDILNQLKDEK